MLPLLEVREMILKEVRRLVQDHAVVSKSIYLKLATYEVLNKNRKGIIKVILFHGTPINTKGNESLSLSLPLLLNSIFLYSYENTHQP